MSFAYLPLFTGDYIRDTRHLTPMKHGIYLLLLMHCWDQKGPLPLDEQECAGIANCRSADEIDALRYVLTRYFTQMVDGWYNKRMQQEIERSENISKERSEAGRKGYESRAKNLAKKENQTIAKHLHNKSQASASTPIPIPILSPSLDNPARASQAVDKSSRTHHEPPTPHPVGDKSPDSKPNGQPASNNGPPPPVRSIRDEAGIEALARFFGKWPLTGEPGCDWAAALRYVNALREQHFNASGDAVGVPYSQQSQYRGSS